MKQSQALLQEHHEFQFTIIGKEIRNSFSLSENLQILSTFYPPTSWLIQQLFLDKMWPKMKNLREFICCPINYGTIYNIFHIFTEENRKLVEFNCPKLEKFGLHFNFNEGQEFRGEYVPQSDSYVKIECKDLLYFHFSGDNQCGPYKFNLKGKAIVYALYADTQPSAGYVTLDIVKFINFNANVIEETKEAPKLRPFRDYKNIIDTY